MNSSVHWQETLIHVITISYQYGLHVKNISLSKSVEFILNPSNKTFVMTNGIIGACDSC